MGTKRKANGVSKRNDPAPVLPDQSAETATREAKPKIKCRFCGSDVPVYASPIRRSKSGVYRQRYGVCPKCGRQNKPVVKFTA